MNEPLERKIIDVETAAGTFAALRSAGRSVVQCHGCFDIVHPGHIRYLQFARQLGDVLVVSLTGDATMQKGPDRPYIPQELRAENLAALEFVHWVVIDDHPTAAEMLEVLRPDVYVKGREYATAGDPRFLREREIVESYGGRVVFHSGDVVFSSTRLMQNLGRDEFLDEHRLRALCQRNNINQLEALSMLDRFSDVPVVIIGDVVRERYVFCDVGGPSGDSPAPSLRRLGVADYWGGAAAIAAQLAALGARPFLLTAVGTDDASRDVASALDRVGVHGCYLPTRPTLVERQTFVADDTKLFKVTDGLSAPLDSTDERRAASAVLDEIDSARLLIWCDYGFGVVTPGLIQTAMRAARARGAYIAGAAPNQRSEIAALRDCDLLCATERRLREALNDMTSGLPAVAWNLLDRTRSQELLVSLRKRGLIGFERRANQPELDSIELAHRLRSEFIPSFASFHADLLGAEEAVLGTSALTRAVGGSLPLAAYMAAAAESRVVDQSGIAATTANELRTWLTARAELRVESRFLPDAATVADLARLAPPPNAMAPTRSFSRNTSPQSTNVTVLPSAS